jgi:AcrR family transcriptional regulator
VGSTKRERGQATRAKILRATAELIAEQGWFGFSTREIAARAGVTQGIVSYHWRSKDDLVRDAALTASAETLAPVYDVLDQAPSVRVALGRLLELETVFRDQPQLTLLLFETMLQAGRDPQLRLALAAMLRDFRTLLAGAIADEGAVEPEATAAALTAALDGLFLHAVVDNQLDVHAAGTALLSLLDQPPPSRATSAARAAVSTVQSTTYCCPLFLS